MTGLQPGLPSWPPPQAGEGTIERIVLHDLKAGLLPHAVGEVGMGSFVLPHAAGRNDSYPRKP